MKIYIAAPLFNEMEIERNKSINHLLKEEGFDTYLPQKDGGLFYDLQKKGYSENEIRNQIFRSDYNAILESDIILCLLDGRVPDEGMCIELGIAYANSKICIGYKTDYRTQDKFGNNIMLEGILSQIITQRSELINYLRAISISDFSSALRY